MGPSDKHLGEAIAKAQNYFTTEPGSGRRTEKEKMIKTKDEMSKLVGSCYDRDVNCSNCPFRRRTSAKTGMSISKTQCYTKHIEEYTKADDEPQAKTMSKDKSIVLKDIARIITERLKIRKKEWYQWGYVQISEDGESWIDEAGRIVSGGFDVLNNFNEFEYYKEPAKTVKKVFYRPIVHMSERTSFGESCIFRGNVWYVDKKDHSTSGVVIKWESEEFEIPEEVVEK